MPPAGTHTTKAHELLAAGVDAVPASGTRMRSVRVEQRLEDLDLELAREAGRKVVGARRGAVAQCAPHELV